MFLQGDSFNFIDRRLVVDAPTVERTSNAYYKEADLVLTEVGPNEIRYLYDDEGNFAGFLLEPEPVQSIIQHSEDFSDDAFWQLGDIQQNLVLWSAEFTTGWTGTDIVATAQSTQQNQHGDDYYTVYANATSSSAKRLRNTTAFALDVGLWQVSFYCRDHGQGRVTIEVFDGTPTQIGRASFDFSGAPILAPNGPIQSASLTDVGGGDYLLRAILNITSAGNYHVGIALPNPDTADGTGAWAGAYNIYQNLLLRSDDFANASWGKLAGGTGSAPVVTTDHFDFGDGTFADRVVFDKGAGTTNSDLSALLAGGAINNFYVLGKVFYQRWRIKSADSNTYTMRIDFNGSTAPGSTITVTPSWQEFVVGPFTAVITDRRPALRLRGTQGTSDYADVHIQYAHAYTVPDALYQQTTAAVLRYRKNLIRQSQALNESSEWTRTQLTTVEDSGIAAPSTGGDSHGNFWRVVPNATSAEHRLGQSIANAPSSGVISFLVQTSGYSRIGIRSMNAASTVENGFFVFDSSTGTFVGTPTGWSSLTAFAVSSGYIVYARYTGHDFGQIRIQVIEPGQTTSTNWSGNTTDGILVTRVQVAPADAEYAITTTSQFTGDDSYDNGVLATRAHVSQVHANYAETTTAAVNTLASTLALGADVLGPDGVADSAVEISGTGMLEYSERETGETTHTYTTTSQGVTAIFEMLTPAESSPAPVLVAESAKGENTSSAINFSWPAGYQDDDVLVVVVESITGSGVTISTGAFTKIVETGGGTDSWLTVAWARASGTMSSFQISNLSNDHKVAKCYLYRGLITSGAPLANVELGGNTSNSTTRTIPSLTASRKNNHLMMVTTYGNDSESNATSNWTNDKLTNLTVIADGIGTTLGNGGGFSVATAQFIAPGYIAGLTESMMRSSIFIRYVSGDPIVKLYNYRDSDETEFDLSTGELISGEGEAPEQYANGFWRIAATKDTGFIASEYGFGLELDGTFHIFGANLTPTLLQSQYVLNDDPMTGDTLVSNTGANLVYSNVPEPSPEDAGPNGAAVIWSAGTYSTGDRAIENHVLYQVTASPSTSAQPSVGAVADPPSWVAVSPSNRWKMFSTENGVEVATVADGMIEFVIQSDLLLTDFSVHGIDAEICVITVYEDGDPIFEKTIDLITDYGIDDFYDWCLKERVYIRQFYESGIPWTQGSLLSVRFLNTSGGQVTVGKFVPGVTVNVGILLDDVEIEARDFSRTSRNAFGIATINQGREIDIKRFTIVVDPDRVAYLIEKLKSLGVAATGWGVPGYDGAIVFGFRTRRDVRYSLIDSRAEITIEEV